MKILLIEDDFDLSNTINQYLTKKQHNIIQIFDGSKAYYHIVDEGRYDLYLVDIRLPTVDGLVLTALIKDTYPNANIIVITAESDNINMKKAYELGCDQYIKKPLSFSELDAKMGYFDRKKSGVVYITDQLRYERGKKVLENLHEKIQLSHMESELINLLLEYRGEIVGIERLCEAIWGVDYQECKIRQLINRLKSKVPELEGVIINKKGEGYRLND